MNILEFDDFLFNLDSRELFGRSSGARIHLQPKPARILAALIERRGELVTREELVEAGWSGTVVSYDLALNTCIRQIRAALGDRAVDPRYVQTVPRRGYRFIGHSQHVRARPRANYYRVRLRVPIAIFFAALTLLVALSLTVNPAMVTTTVRVDSVRQLGLDASPNSSVLAAVLEENIRTASVKAGDHRFRVVAPHDAMVDATPKASRAVLDADYVITAALDMAPDGYRLNVQISRSDDALIMWAGEFRPECPDAVDPVGQIARVVSNALVQLLPPRDGLVGAEFIPHRLDFRHSA